MDDLGNETHEKTYDFDRETEQNKQETDNEPLEESDEEN